jgi:hypothetical protein
MLRSRFNNASSQLSRDETVVSVGFGIEALPTATHDGADDRSDKIPVPV